jgi:hypothetical protein
MQATASVSGRVFDENDEPLANATIEVLTLQESSNAPRMWMPFRGGQGIPGPRPVETDDLGKYRVAGLEPGEYLIRLTPTEEQSKALRYPSRFIRKRRMLRRPLESRPPVAAKPRTSICASCRKPFVCRDDLFLTNLSRHRVGCS